MKMRQSLFEWRGYSITAPLLLVLIFLTGLAIILLRPVWSLENRIPLKVDASRMFTATNFGLTSHPKFDMIRLFNKAGSAVIEYTNKARNLTIEQETTGFFVYDYPIRKTESNSWFAVRSEDKNCYICSAFDENGNPGMQTYLFHNNPWIGKITSDYSNFGDNLQVTYTVSDELKDNYIIEKKEDIVYIRFQKDYFSKLSHLDYKKIEASEEYAQLAEKLTNYTGYNFINRDIFRILIEKRRNYWYKNTLDTPRGSSFFVGNILAWEDFDNSGRKDFLILVNGDRFIPCYLYRYNYVDKEVVWSQPLYICLYNLEVSDIDKDGEKEIILSTYGSGSGCSEDWFDQEIPLYSFKSYLIVLDSDGHLENYNGHDALLETGGFSTEVMTGALDSGSIIAANTFHHPSDLKKPFIINFMDNTIDSLDIEYNQAISFEVTGNTIEFYYFLEDKTYKSVLDYQGKEIEKFMIDKNVFGYFKARNKFNFQNEEYIIGNPFSIVTNDLKPVYQSSKFSINELEQDGEDIYFSSKRELNHEFDVYKLNISKNTTLNKFYLLIWLFTMLLLLVHLFTRTLFTLPEDSIDGTYAVLYSFLGLLYNWRIFGKTSAYTQPVVISFSKNRFYDTITDLSENYHKVSIKKLGFLKLHIYRLVIDNEMHIVQRIAHDIKNQLHLVNIKLQEDQQSDKGAPEEFMKIREGISSALNEIFYKTSMLSNFSRINLMKTSSCDLISIIDDILIRYSAHPRLSDINWEPEINSLECRGDEILLQTAFFNIIDNAIKYSPDDTPIDLSVKDMEDCIIFTVINQKKSNGSCKNGFRNFGSGIGLMITEKIVNTHRGELDITIEDNCATTAVILYKDI